ncbi:MAG: hypothetical protein E7616_05975 [Ruminococcaceae bacterium]|nr:hypothetical protein [Oscillospiraceae bacterium]
MVQFVKTPAILFTFCKNYGTIQLLDKRVFDEGNRNMFNEIKTSKDIQVFLEKTNYLHDGYIINVQYTHNGITKIENGHYFNPTQTKLILQILVTSIWDTVVEIEFESLLEWQIKDNHRDITDTSVIFDEQNWIVWSDGVCISMDEVKKSSYVIAESMKWRIVE